MKNRSKILRCLKYTLNIFLFTFIFSCSSNTKKEIEEWEQLFNGKNLENWIIKFANQNLNYNYKNTFRVQDSMIRVMYETYDQFENSYAHLFYKQPFSYYKLKFDYRFLGNQVKGGAVWNKRNSGVMLHSQSPESTDFGQYFPVSIEIQLLGGLGENKRNTGNLCTPGTAVVIDNQINYTHCINSKSKTYHGDQWVSAEVIVYGHEQITHIIENDTVLKYYKPQIGGGFSQPHLGDDDWSSNGIDSKNYWLSKEGELLDSGYIALQAESHPIDFKNIKLLNLCGCMDKKAKNFKSYFIKENNSECIY
tara:strand:- start:2291 stop:3211 length:921 start_codon:yes stop_codon:yes gene_type:complete